MVAISKSGSGEGPGRPRPGATRQSPQAATRSHLPLFGEQNNLIFFRRLERTVQLMSFRGPSRPWQFAYPPGLG